MIYADGTALMPYYVAVDTCIENEQFGERLRQALADLASRLTDFPAVLDSARLAVIDAGSTTTIWERPVVLDRFRVPKLRCAGSAFGLAQLLRAARDRIDTDVDELRVDGRRVLRPVMFVLASGAPGEAWRTAHDQLTRWDPDTKYGFRRYPIIVPVTLTALSHRSLDRLAFPPNRAAARLVDAPGQPAAAVTAAMAFIENVITASAATAQGQARTVLPDVDPYADRSIERLARRTDASHTPRPKETYAVMGCATAGGLTIGRFMLHGEGWQLTESAAYNPRPGRAVGESIDLTGQFQTSPNYRGCSRCEKRSYVQCGTCRKLSCWDPRDRTYTCGFCGISGPVSGSISGIRSNNG